MDNREKNIRYMCTKYLEESIRPRKISSDDRKQNYLTMYRPKGGAEAIPLYTNGEGSTEEFKRIYKSDCKKDNKKCGKGHTIKFHDYDKGYSKVYLDDYNENPLKNTKLLQVFPWGAGKGQTNLEMFWGGCGFNFWTRGKYDRDGAYLKFWCDVDPDFLLITRIVFEEGKLYDDNFNHRELYGIIDYLVALKSRYFIGCDWSSFSIAIKNHHQFYKKDYNLLNIWKSASTY